MSEVARSYHVHIRPRSGWIPLDLGELWSYRDVLFMLAARDIKLRYRQTFLGVLWVVLQPLAAGVIFALVFGRFAGLPSDGVSYLLFSFAGLITWSLFSGIIQRAGNSLVVETRLITKVYFPRMLVPLAAAAAAIIDYSIGLLVLGALMCWESVWPGWWICLVPVACVLTLLLGVGASLWLSALNVRYRDFVHAQPFLTQVLMYASPVVYSFQLVPEELRFIYSVNPLVGLIESGRAAILGGGQFLLISMTISVIWAAVVFVTGALFFRRVERRFAEDL